MLIATPDIWKSRNKTFCTFLQDRLIVPIESAIHLLDIDQILYLSADSNYCKVVLKEGPDIFCAKTLKYFEHHLMHRGFLRIHSSYMVNLKYVTAICRTSGFQVCVKNDVKLPVSRRYKNLLFDICLKG